MFRTLFVTQGERLTIQDNWLCVARGDSVSKVPLADIQTLVVDNVRTLVSVYTLQALASSAVNLIVCDERHMPCASLLPLDFHYRPYGVLKKQLALTQDFKDLLWKRVAAAKIRNQAAVLTRAGASKQARERLLELAGEVLPGDPGNREGIAAKMYFRALYGVDFLRFGGDCINSALNYGYALMRSVTARSLCAYGYTCGLGIHHISEGNGFNLADDFMEPLRPLVDLWAHEHRDELVDDLSKDNRAGLIGLLNGEVFMKKNLMKVYNAAERMAASLTTAIDTSDPDRLILPSLSPPAR